MESKDDMREAMRARIRDLLRDMGFAVPDRLSPREIIVRDEDGKIIERKWVGGHPDDE